jgi:hypothetical protein
MVFELGFRDFLHLRSAQGAAIEVLDGRVWITENGAGDDAFLAAGRCYRVRGRGLVVVGAEGGARVEVRGPAARSWLSRLFGGEPRVSALSDRMLRDIGLRRDQLR